MIPLAEFAAPPLVPFIAFCLITLIVVRALVFVLAADDDDLPPPPGAP